MVVVIRTFLYLNVCLTKTYREPTSLQTLKNEKHRQSNKSDYPADRQREPAIPLQTLSSLKSKFLLE